MESVTPPRPAWQALFFHAASSARRQPTREAQWIGVLSMENVNGLSG